MLLLWVPTNFPGQVQRMVIIIFIIFVNSTEAPAFASGPARGCCVGGRSHSLHRFTRLRKLNIVSVDNVRPVGRQPLRVERRPYSLCLADASSTKIVMRHVFCTVAWAGYSPISCLSAAS
jgi:hypothetical protein